MHDMLNQISNRLATIEANTVDRHEENGRRLEKIEEVLHANGAALIAGELRIKHLDECIDDVKYRLFGNGQPGEITRMSVRISALEKWLWRAVGALSAAMFIVSVLLALEGRR